MGNIIWQSQSHKRCDSGHRIVTLHRVTSHSHGMWLKSQLMSNMRTIGDKVHSYDSNCIYSVVNLIETLLNSFYQLLNKEQLALF